MPPICFMQVAEVDQLTDIALMSAGVSSEVRVTGLNSALPHERTFQRTTALRRFCYKSICGVVNRNFQSR